MGFSSGCQAPRPNLGTLREPRQVRPLLGEPKSVNAQGRLKVEEAETATAQIPFKVCILIHVLSNFNHGALLDSKVANSKHNGFRCRVRLQARLTSHGIPHLKMV